MNSASCCDLQQEPPGERVPATTARRHPRALIRAADRLDAQTVELDIRARWHEAQAGYRWALSRDHIKKKECEERGINEDEFNEDEWCKRGTRLRHRHYAATRAALPELG